MFCHAVRYSIVTNGYFTFPAASSRSRILKDFETLLLLALWHNVLLTRPISVKQRGTGRDHVCMHQASSLMYLPMKILLAVPWLLRYQTSALHLLALPPRRTIPNCQPLFFVSVFQTSPSYHRVVDPTRNYEHHILQSTGVTMAFVRLRRRSYGEGRPAIETSRELASWRMASKV